MKWKLVFAIFVHLLLHLIRKHLFLWQRGPGNENILGLSHALKDPGNQVITLSKIQGTTLVDDDDVAVDDTDGDDTENL